MREEQPADAREMPVTWAQRHSKAAVRSLESPLSAAKRPSENPVNSVAVRPSCQDRLQDHRTSFPHGPGGGKPKSGPRVLCPGEGSLLAVSSQREPERAHARSASLPVGILIPSAFMSLFNLNDFLTAKTVTLAVRPPTYDFCGVTLRPTAVHVEGPGGASAQARGWARSDWALLLESTVCTGHSGV